MYIWAPNAAVASPSDQGSNLDSEGKIARILRNDLLFLRPVLVPMEDGVDDLTQDQRTVATGECRTFARVLTVRGHFLADGEGRRVVKPLLELWEIILSL